MIIGLSGLKGSGKDTVGAYLVKQYNFERRAFADKLKESIAALFDIPFEDIDRWKNDEHVRVGMSYILNTAIDEHLLPPNDLSPFVTFRTLLQRYGTEAHRDIFGEDFWVDAILPKDGFYSGRAIVVTDVRFANEAERVVEIGGFIVKVVRPGTDNADRHRSETLEVESDYTLMNSGTVEELYNQVEIMLGDLG